MRVVGTLYHEQPSLYSIPSVVTASIFFFFRAPRGSATCRPREAREARRVRGPRARRADEPSPGSEMCVFVV
eukprot:scaffold324_cov394-Prasinococcus_capsulatus_cf.AAC.23